MTEMMTRGSGIGTYPGDVCLEHVHAGAKTSAADVHAGYFVIGLWSEVNHVGLFFSANVADRQRVVSTNSFKLFGCGCFFIKRGDRRYLANYTFVSQVAIPQASPAELNGFAQLRAFGNDFYWKG